jgi:phage repressor protein C with HTH and peptisase S24 domain
MSIFKDKLNEKLREKGMDNNAEIARIIGVSDVAISKWRSGEAKPKGDNLVKLAKMLETSPEVLIGNIEPSLPQDDYHILDMPDNFINRVKSLMVKRGYRSQKELSEATGIGQSTLSEWISQGREPKLEHFLLLADKLNTTPQYLWYGTEDTSQDNYRKAEVYHMAGAGMPYQLIESEPFDSVWLKKEFLNNHIVVVKVRGHSMEPTIMDGACIGVDISDRQIVSGEMYALWIPYEGAIIKRINVDPRGTIQVISDNSDNKRYPTVNLQPKELDESFIQGRVKWVIQKV